MENIFSEYDTKIFLLAMGLSEKLEEIANNIGVDVKDIINLFTLRLDDLIIPELPQEVEDMLKKVSIEQFLINMERYYHHGYGNVSATEGDINGTLNKEVDVVRAECEYMFFPSDVGEKTKKRILESRLKKPNGLLMCLDDDLKICYIPKKGLNKNDYFKDLKKGELINKNEYCDKIEFCPLKNVKRVYKIEVDSIREFLEKKITEKLDPEKRERVYNEIKKLCKETKEILQNYENEIREQLIDALIPKKPKDLKYIR